MAEFPSLVIQLGHYGLFTKGSVERFVENCEENMKVIGEIFFDKTG